MKRRSWKTLKKNGIKNRITGEHGGFGASSRFYSKLAEIRRNKKMVA
jgi:hypothetical protein